MILDRNIYKYIYSYDLLYIDNIICCNININSIKYDLNSTNINSISLNNKNYKYNIRLGYITLEHGVIKYNNISNIIKKYNTNINVINYNFNIINKSNLVTSSWFNNS